MTINTIGHKERSQKHLKMKGIIIQNPIIKILNNIKNRHLLPIWRFQNEKQRKKNVTCIVWNPRYPDLFAVGLGSYDFSKQRMGLICLYSLKNTTHPEYAYSCEAGYIS